MDNGRGTACGGASRRCCACLDRVVARACRRAVGTMNIVHVPWLPPLYMAQHDGGPPTMNRLSALDLGALEEVSVTSRWDQSNILPLELNFILIRNLKL